MTDYTVTSSPLQGSRGVSPLIRGEFIAIEAAVNSKANIASPTFTGIPRADTAAVGASGTQLATLDFVVNTSLTTNLPAQTGNATKYIQTDGANASWQYVIPHQLNMHTGVI